MILLAIGVSCYCTNARKVSADSEWHTATVIGRKELLYPLEGTTIHYLLNYNGPRGRRQHWFPSTHVKV